MADPFLLHHNFGDTFNRISILDDLIVPNLPFTGYTPITGLVTINPSDGLLYFYNGTSWLNAGGGGSGTVTSVGTGIGLTGGPITTFGTIALANTVVTPGSYTNTNLTVDAQGRITSAANGTTSSGTVTSVNGIGGTGINVTGGPITLSGTLTITNTAPDQTVLISGGTGINILGSYPSFIITNSSPSTGGTVTSISTTSPLTGGTIITTGTLGITQSSTSIDGYLSHTDWNTFNGKQASLSGTGIVKSTLGTISYISGTTSQFVKGDGSLDSSTYLTTISGITAGGDLTGTYVNPTIGANKVTYNKIQQEAANTLLGNPTGSLANVSEITLGSGLSFSGTTLISVGTGGTVTSISGTVNRITSTGGTTPIIDISTSYVGQTSITTLGTITSGTWTGTKIGLLYGGTNSDLSSTGGTSNYLKQSSVGAAITVGTIPASDISSGAALTKADDTNVTLTLGGSPTTALLSASSITAGWTGQLGLTRGGTAASLVASVGGIVYSSSSALSILSGVATASKMLLSGSSAAPTWSTSTIPTSAGSTANKILLSDGTNYVLSTPTFPNASATSRKIIVSDGTNWVASTETYAVPGTSGNTLISNGTNWISASPATLGTVTSIATTSPILGGTITSTGTISLGTVPYANGGTNATTSWTSGTIPFFGASTMQQDNNNLFWNISSHILSVNTNGDQGGTDSISVYAQVDHYQPNSAQGTINSTTMAGTSTSSSRGTGPSPTANNSGDIIGNNAFWAYTNLSGSTTYVNIAGVAGTVSGSGGTNGLGGELDFYVKADNSTTYTKAMQILSTGHYVLEGVTTTGATGTGNMVYSIDPALTVTTPTTTSFGYLGIPQNSKSAAYTTVMTDAGKHLYHPGADTTARIWTIDTNTNVPYPIGTTLTFVNDTSAGVITISTSDTLVLAGAGTTGSRTLAANGMATAIKMTSTRWMINGTNLT